MRGLGLLGFSVLAACGTPAFDPQDHGDSTEPSGMSGMVAAHNAARAAATPAPATPLADVVWSSTLAAVAQAYAEECVFEHSGADGLGENLYAEAGRTSAAAAVVEDWASEAQFYDYASNGCARGKQCGHYTQVVWRDTRYVGCGRASCTRNTPFTGAGAAWVHWVCNYDPPGNVVGQKPY